MRRGKGERKKIWEVDNYSTFFFSAKSTSKDSKGPGGQSDHSTHQFAAGGC